MCVCFGSLSSIQMIVIPDNACVNTRSSIFSATDAGTASVRYLWDSHLIYIYTSAVHTLLFIMSAYISS